MAYDLELLDKSIQVEFTTKVGINIIKDTYIISKDDAQLLKLPLDENKLITRFREFKRHAGVSIG